MHSRSWAGLILSLSVARPLRGSINIDGESPKLDFKSAKRFHTGLGIVGWLNMTCRPDVAQCHAESAMDALQHCFRYLIGSKHWGLSGPMHKLDQDLLKPLFPDLGGVVNDQYGWRFFVDTDFLGNLNAEVQNKRRSQVGILALFNSAPVYWKSSVTQCYANENFEEDHPDRSSGASESRGVGNATMDFLRMHNIMHLSYIAREAGIKFPKPFVLRIDNDTARARIFANGTCFRLRMKHNDCAQEWVRILRDKTIIMSPYLGQH